MAFFQAAKRGNDDQLSELITEENEDPKQVDSLHYTALHWAASGGHTDCIKILLKYDVDVNAKNNVGDTPLHMAAWRNHAQACKLLIEAGAKRDIKNLNGQVPLDLCRDEEVRSVVVPPPVFEEDVAPEDPDSD
eukprot:TRINITY_DN88_c0_g1_i1.p1 TRINITY_DN88_c0_g1~~TRINITY_DN88_c0_g1_i1.p1  ORF type:complete len:134 (-),score=37.57 TRINITY_DN88_c0_g1_i1:117-518(-)